MSYNLVKFETPLRGADEFSVYGMRIMHDSEYKEYLAEAKKALYPDEHYFGSNEAIELNSFKDVEDSLTIEILSATHAQVISDKLGDEFGWFPNFGDY